MVDGDARVGCDGAVLVHNQRVEVQFPQPGQLADHFRNVEEDIFEGLHADRWQVAEFAEEEGGAR